MKRQIGSLEKSDYIKKIIIIVLFVALFLSSLFIIGGLIYIKKSSDNHASINEEDNKNNIAEEFNHNKVNAQKIEIINGKDVKDGKIESTTLENNLKSEDKYEKVNVDDVVYLGEKLTASWSPELIDAYSVGLLPVSDYVEYDFQYLPTNIELLKQGIFEYELWIDNLISIYPGQYRLVVDDKNNENSIHSSVFEIKSPSLIRYDRVDYAPWIAETYYTEVDNGYIINTIISGDGINPDEGWELIVFPIGDYEIEEWHLIMSEYQNGSWYTFMPKDIFENIDTYQLLLECSDLSYNSICAQKYGHNEDNLYIMEYISVIR